VPNLLASGDIPVEWRPAACVGPPKRRAHLGSRPAQAVNPEQSLRPNLSDKYSIEGERAQ
jgi:hypothetical protein